MRLISLVVAGLLGLAWLFLVISMATLGWATLTRLGVTANVGLMRSCVTIPGVGETCGSIKDGNGSCARFYHGGRFVFSLMLIAMFTGLVGVVISSLTGLELSMPPLDGPAQTVITLTASMLVNALLGMSWVMYCVIVYSSDCYKDNSYEAGYSFALCFVAWILFALPASILALLDQMGIKVPGLSPAGAPPAK